MGALGAEEEGVQGDAAPRPTNTPNESTAFALWYAHRQRRTSDMLQLMAPDVVWVPAVPVGPTEYAGHAGIRRMNREMLDLRGDYSVRLEHVTETQPDVVLAQGQIVSDGAEIGIPIQFDVEFRGGLITKVVARLVPATAGAAPRR